MIPYYFLGVLAVLWQGVSGVIVWPAVVVVVAAGRRQNAGEVYSLAFICGVLADLMTGKLLGQTATGLLILAGLVFLLKSRFYVFRN